MASLLGALLLLAMTSAGCSKHAWNVALRSAAAGMAAQAPESPPALLLFGGTDHKTFIGCLNCVSTDADSVLNSLGTYGSDYSDDSIFNHYGQFGSPYSDSSACNPYASDPPVIVDDAGTFYGRLTLNAYSAERGIGAQFVTWLKSVCSD